MATLKRLGKIVRENAFDDEKKRPGLKLNPRLALIGLSTTGPWCLNYYAGAETGMKRKCGPMGT